MFLSPSTPLCGVKCGDQAVIISIVWMWQFFLTAQDSICDYYFQTKEVYNNDNNIMIIQRQIETQTFKEKITEE